MKVLLAAGALMVTLLASAVTGGVLTATGDEPSARSSPVRTADGNPAAREFVTAKKAWTACVAKTAPAHDVEEGRFDPERACGTKPHPHDIAGKHSGKNADQPGDQKHEDHGSPAWSGGPDRRTAEPPGHATRSPSAGRGRARQLDHSPARPRPASAPVTS